jgi:hypothetical protein
LEGERREGKLFIVHDIYSLFFFIFASRAFCFSVRTFFSPAFFQLFFSSRCGRLHLTLPFPTASLVAVGEEWKAG